MKIEIIQKPCGGTEFIARPHRLHLGAQNAVGVDELQFLLPDAWADCAVALYLRRSDGTLMAPVSLDRSARVTVDRRLTGSTGGQWMLAALRGSEYTAYTRPGSYDAYPVLPTDGGSQELPPSQYEQFVSRVLESAGAASTAAQRAGASAASCTASAAQAQAAAQNTRTDRAAVSQAAARAEAAAARAEALAPEEGRVVSVNGKAGLVQLTAQDVGALPCPAQPVSGQLLQVLSVDPEDGALVVSTTPPPDLSPYVRSAVLPTASTAGAVKADPAYGVTVRSDGTLTTAPADAAALDAMTDAWLPVTPALLPCGVKKALTEAAAAARWTADEKKTALRTLGADLSAYYTKEDIDVLLSAPSISAYPVGSIYQSTDAASPAALFGGTWEQIASDRVLMGASGTHAAATTAEAGLPNITGSMVEGVADQGPFRTEKYLICAGAFRGVKKSNAYAGHARYEGANYDLYFDASASNAVYGASDTVQPPAYYVHIWRRVA